MKKFLPVLLIVIAVVSFMSMNVLAERDQSLYYVMTIGDFYNVEYDQVNEIVNKGLEAEELPVVYFISDRAEAPVQDIARLRLENNSWMSIIGEYQLNASIFHVKVPGTIRYEPYVSIYKKYEKLDNSEWNTIVLNDEEVVNLVNLNFMALNHDDFSLNHIIRMRSDSLGFASINERITIINETIATSELAKK